MVKTSEVRPRRSKRGLLIGLAGLGAVAAIAVSGILDRFHADRVLTRVTDAAAVPTVSVVKPVSDTKPNELVLPGDIQAWYTAPIYARVPGYLKMWYKDYGALVKAGDLLGEIDAPDLDQEYERAKGDLKTAMANLKLADITAQRWQKLVNADAVSRQDTDVKVQTYAATRAAAEAAQANVSRLAALEGFKRLIAPFDGVVTARKTDVGALINVGSGVGPEMFEVSDVHEMRVYVLVPQAYTAQIKVGMKTELALPQFPRRRFPATVATTAQAINTSSRTLLVELHAPNPAGELVPGTYAQIFFELPADADALRVPVSALVFQEHGLQVATLDATNRVVMKNVQIGLDMGATVEIVAGLATADRVIDSPPDSIQTGDLVRVMGDKTTPPGHTPAEHEQVSEAARASEARQ